MHPLLPSTKQMTYFICRCGPFQPALQVLQDPRMRTLVNSMVTSAMPLSKGLEAIKLAQSKGALKVQLVM